jgi:hypothetical protein
MPRLIRPRLSRAPVKTTVNLPADSADLLRSLADARGTTLAEVIRRALRLEEYLTQVREDGGRLLVETQQGEEKTNVTKELVIF